MLILNARLCLRTSNAKLTLNKTRAVILFIFNDCIQLSPLFIRFHWFLSYPTFLLFYPILLLPIRSFPFIADPILASFPVLCHPVFTVFKYSSSLSLPSYHFFLFSFFFLSHPSPPHPILLFLFIIQSYPILSCAPFHFPSHPIPSTVILRPVQSYPILPHPSLVSYPGLAYVVLFLSWYTILPYQNFYNIIPTHV